VTAVANQFIIRQIIPGHPDFMYSSNIWEVAERQGFWSKSDGLLDFLKTYAPMRAHSPYATRRVWRIFNIVAPHLMLNPYTDSYASEYPFSVKPERPLTPVDVMNIQRDHYEGTEFDMTKGLAAGPYGDPNRFDPAAVDNMTFAEVLTGSYQRSVSLFRTSYSFVAQAREVPDELTLLWFGPHAPSSTSYAPLYLQADDVPKQYSRFVWPPLLVFLLINCFFVVANTEMCDNRGSLFKFDDKIAFWNFLAVSNYAGRFYKYAMVDVKIAQEQLMAQSLAAVAQTEAAVMTLIQQGKDNKAVEAILSNTVHEQASHIANRWKNLLYEVITHFHDGYIARKLDTPDIDMHKIFYSKEWLQATGYFDSVANSGPGVILFASKDSMLTMDQSNGRVFTAVIFTTVFVSFFTVVSMMIVQKKTGVLTVNRDYLPVDNL
jgi:dipeptidase